MQVVVSAVLVLALCLEPKPQKVASRCWDIVAQMPWTKSRRVYERISNIFPHLLQQPRSVDSTEPSIGYRKRSPEDASLPTRCMDQVLVQARAQTQEGQLQMKM